MPPVPRGPQPTFSIADGCTSAPIACFPAASFSRTKLFGAQVDPAGEALPAATRLCQSVRFSLAACVCQERRVRVGSIVRKACGALPCRSRQRRTQATRSRHTVSVFLHSCWDDACRAVCGRGAFFRCSACCSPLRILRGSRFAGQIAGASKASARAHRDPVWRIAGDEVRARCSAGGRAQRPPSDHERIRIHEERNARECLAAGRMPDCDR